MNKKFSYIIMSLCLLSILLAPFSPLVQVHNAELTIGITANNAHAQTAPTCTPPATLTTVNGVQVPVCSDGTPAICPAGSQPVMVPVANVLVCAAPTAATPIACSGGAQPANGQCPTGTTATQCPNGFQINGTGCVTNNPPSDYLYEKLGDCGITSTGGFENCLVVLFYYLSVSIPSWLMSVTAKFFDYMASLTLSDVMYRAGFIQTIWQIVRDFANIFFILILLYAAFAIILGLGKGGGKKIVAMVILVALLVNFSLFFSKVIIDTSNVLALIFYNKVSCTDDSGQACPNLPTSDPTVSKINEKPLAAALTSRFNVNRFFTAEFLDNQPPANVQKRTTLWFIHYGEALKPTYAVALEFTYGLVAWSLAFIFLLVGLSFLSRLVTLMLLMIVSPLAFVTASVPGFSKVDTIGWSSWIKQLIQTSFIATVFMALLYLIAEIVSAKPSIFNSMPNTQLDVIQRLILIFIPAVLIVIMLWKGTKYVMKASGALTGAIMSGAAAVGGFALGAVTGGVAMAGSGIIGGAASKAANSESLKQKAQEKGMGGYLARLQLKTFDSISKKSFDARKTTAMGALGSATKMNFQSASAVGLGSKAGGFKGAQERHAKKLEEESKLYKTNMSDDQVKAWSEARQFKYDSDLRAAKTAAGSNATKAELEFIKKNGEAPKSVATADQLNGERMKSFVDNLGQSGFLGSLAYSSVKSVGGLVNEGNYKQSQPYKNWAKTRTDTEEAERKRQGITDDKTSDPYKIWQKKFNDTYAATYNKKEPTADSINKQTVAYTKMAMGGGAAIATGGLIGGAVGAGGAGAILGGGMAWGSGETEGAGEKKFASNMTKQLGSLGKLNDRIGELNQVMAKGKGLNRMPIPGAGNNPDGTPKTVGLFVQNEAGIDTDRIDREKLEDAIADNGVSEIDLNNQLRGNPNDQGIRDRLKATLKEKATLTSLRTAQTELINLTGKKAETEGGTKPVGGTATPPPAGSTTT